MLVKSFSLRPETPVSESYSRNSSTDEYTLWHRHSTKSLIPVQLSHVAVQLCAKPYA